MTRVTQDFPAGLGQKAKFGSEFTVQIDDVRSPKLQFDGSLDPTFYPLVLEAITDTNGNSAQPECT